MLKAPGVYSIIHTATGRSYVGSSMHVSRRWYVHRWELRGGRHPNHKLQHAWNKYGEDAFEFHLIHEVEFNHELVVWEQFWIDILKPYYNLRLIAESMLGFKHSAESRARHSALKRGRKLAEEHRRNIGLASRGRIMTKVTREKLSAAHKGRKKSPEHIAKTAAGHAKTYRFLNPAGELVELTNLNAFCRENGLLQGSMSALWFERIAQHRGWRGWSYAGIWVTGRSGGALL